MMRTINIRLGSIALCLCTGFVSDVAGQGALNPPGPPAPMMKTLDQVEPRTPISSLPFEISEPGSYYVTTNLTGNPHGITILASGVTLDLGGFELVGGTGSGIAISGTRTNVVIRNGTLRGWGWNGIRSRVATNLTANCAISVRVLGNEHAGIQLLGRGDQIIDCLAYLNSNNGFTLGDYGAISGSLAIGNGNIGIRAGIGCLVVDNRSEENDSDGIFAFGNGNRIDANHLSRNLGAGIQALGEDNWIVRNTARDNVDGDYNLFGDNEVGPIGGMADVGDNPWANFSF